MFKRTLLVLALTAAGIVSAAESAPVVVYLRADPAPIAPLFSHEKTAFEFRQTGDAAFTAPVPTKAGPLDVPASIRSDRKEHLVEVGIVISDHGQVLSTAIVSSNSKGFEPAALKMARGFRFRPATLDGKPVATYAVLPATYRYVDPAEMAKTLADSAAKK